jgi:serine/threonine protein kinase/WD40 repeat protein
MTAPVEAARCPDCGSDLVSEPGLPGLCPQCLMSLALVRSPVAVKPDAADHEGPETLHRLSAGRILGERYQIRELLGRGGMGEVFRAFDLKLRLDVALKAVRAERVESDEAREILRQEVRSAREVVSPNVCRIFDLVAEEGQELVSMEFIDGTTLADTLRQRGPLALQEAREIASQFLSGLEAIHQAGLVHRDFKPENVMLTRAGRVVVMDFGLAKARSAERTGTIAGTPGYMAPEQARGDTIDARTDVFAAGVVLSEMLAVGGDSSREARQALWRAVRETPPRVPEGPWAAVLRQAVSPRPQDRPASARALAHALEEVTQRLPGFESLHPYPGLASFTEEDAEYFFGRELEVEALWRKLRRPRLLALVAPSGAGKSSFLRAGLLPTLPKGWKALVATPGSRPFQALARTLVPVFAGDTQATEALLRFEDLDTAVSLLQRYRQRHEHALVVVDQFEELFTLNPPEVQKAFSELLGRLALEADLHVLLSLRDDFLLRCREQEPLVPAFSDLTPLGTLSDSALRRALVQPALACGYRFEDEALADEMIDEVQRERGALPLLAFAASRLWEKRDHERGLLTRAAYREIGGVAGALAQHAEATLERIGAHRTPIVRELFRNLVTAQGTRAVRERGELLSIFAGDAERRAEAESVLSALVDARLLTSYERAGESGEARQQVEIIHESLLANWPRLVRWQTQDADGAQLHDQLRQAAQLWHDRGQSDDLLWSGAAYRDYALWRERYPVPLSATEDAFAKAMEANATRRRRRRRAAVATIVSALALGLAVTGVLWTRAEAARRKAETETLRAEAGKLLALGQPLLDEYPSAVVAYAIKSLELSDTDDGRLLALRALQRGPAAFVLSASPNGPQTLTAAFSPDGSWLAVGGYQAAELLHRDGRPPVVVGERPSRGFGFLDTAFSSAGDMLLTNLAGEMRAYSIPEGRELWKGQGDPGMNEVWVHEDRAYTVGKIHEKDGRPDWAVREWDVRTGSSHAIGTADGQGLIDPTSGIYVYESGGPGGRILARGLDRWTSPRLVTDHQAEIRGLAVGPEGRSLAVSDASGEIRIWPMGASTTRASVVLQAPGTAGLRFDPRGRRLAAFGEDGQRKVVRLFDLAGLPVADPLELRRNDVQFFNGLTFGPDGRWLVTAHAGDFALWPLPDRSPRVLSGHTARIHSVVFTPDGRWLLSSSSDGTVRAWPLDPDAGVESKVLFKGEPCFPLSFDPSSRRIAFASGTGHVFVVPLDGGPPWELKGFSEKTWVVSVVFSPDGRLVAAAPIGGPVAERVVRVWNLETGQVSVFGPIPGAEGTGPQGGAFGGPTKLTFLSRNRLLLSLPDPLAGDVVLSIDSGKMHVIDWSQESGVLPLANLVSRDESITLGTRPLVSREAILKKAEGEPPTGLVRYSPEGGPIVSIPSHGTAVFQVALDPTETKVATGSVDGTVRIGPVAGGEPHLFLAHEGLVRSVQFSPDGQWLASAGEDGKIRLWPVPDVTKPPLHKRPLAELLATLRSCTNLRVAPDPTLPGHYRLVHDAFPGWGKLPDC